MSFLHRYMSIIVHHLLYSLLGTNGKSKEKEAITSTVVELTYNITQLITMIIVMLHHGGYTTADSQPSHNRINKVYTGNSQARDND